MRGLDSELFDQRLYAGFVGRTRPITSTDGHRMCGFAGCHPGPGRAATDDLRALSELTAVMRKFRPHIVHTHTAKAGALGRVAAVLARVPVRVHTFHGHLLQGYFSPAKTRLVVQAERSLAAHHRLVAVGCSIRDDLLAAGIGRPGQYAVVPPGTHRTHLPGAPRRAGNSASQKTASSWPTSGG